MKSVGTGMQYIVYLVPLGEGWQGPFEVGWHQNAVYSVFGAIWRGLDGSKWMPNSLGMGWASTVLSQALKPPGAPRLEATTPLVARGGFMFYFFIFQIFVLKMINFTSKS